MNGTVGFRKDGFEARVKFGILQGKHDHGSRLSDEGKNSRSDEGDGKCFESVVIRMDLLSDDNFIKPISNVSRCIETQEECDENKCAPFEAEGKIGEDNEGQRGDPVHNIEGDGAGLIDAIETTGGAVDDRKKQKDLEQANENEIVRIHATQLKISANLAIKSPFVFLQEPRQDD